MLPVEITIHAAQVTMLDPMLSADKRAKVQARMQGPAVLDSARYPQIRLSQLESSEPAHYLTIGFTDDAGKDQVAVIELGKRDRSVTAPPWQRLPRSQDRYFSARTDA